MNITTINNGMTQDQLKAISQVTITIEEGSIYDYIERENEFGEVDIMNSDYHTVFCDENFESAIEYLFELDPYDILAVFGHYGHGSILIDGQGRGLIIINH